MTDLSTMNRFVGRVAAITGAAQGIGAAITCRLAAEGAQVAMLDRQTIRDDFFPTSAAKYTVDVTDHQSVSAVIEAIYRQFGRIDIWVNNAGIYTSAPFTEMRMEDWQRALNVNLTGAMVCMQSVAPFMVAQRYGRIINVASLAGVIGFPNSAAYCATKAGVVGLTRSAAIDLGPYGVTVNAVCPGTLLTEMGYKVDELICKQNGWEPGTFLKMRAQELPVRRLGTPEDVAGAVAFLASDDASWITGQALVIDGGQFPF
ncbi:MAG: SDR family oxidoreductase [Chloroflexota bacterium]|jgi:NAD(P)-dependent dehydrogenase (short-subunit alcohol dehydrogenase family)|nr:MAG: SDR family oxidoreductase [Chloroflexota bacterium]